MVNITGDQVIEALAAFISPFVSANQIVRGQVNRVPPPAGSDFVVLTELLEVDLETPALSNADQITTISAPKRVDIQADFYGDNSWDYATAVKTVYRSEYATSQFPDGIKPLYCSDATQHPLITGEQQYLSRWTITISLQYNPALTVPQQSATVVTQTIMLPADLMQ
jgi:hypothetical protein